MLWLLACTSIQALPDVAYGGGELSGTFELEGGEEGLRGDFELPGTEDPGAFELEDCEEHGAVLIRRADRAQSRLVGCIELAISEELRMHSIPEVCDITDFARVRVDLHFDDQSGELDTQQSLFYVVGRPSGGIHGWSVEGHSLVQDTERGGELVIEDLEWILDAPGCGWDLGTLSHGSAELAWDFDLEPRAEL